MTHEKRLCTFIVQVFSQGREFFEPEESYSGEILKKQDTKWWHWGRDSTWLLLRSHETDLFESVELYSEDDLEMAGHSAIMVGRYCHIWIIPWYRVVCLCVQLHKVSWEKGQHYGCTWKWSWKEGKNVSCNGNQR